MQTLTGLTVLDWCAALTVLIAGYLAPTWPGTSGRAEAEEASAERERARARREAAREERGFD